MPELNLVYVIQMDPELAKQYGIRRFFPRSTKTMELTLEIVETKTGKCYAATLRDAGIQFDQALAEAARWRAYTWNEAAFMDTGRSTRLLMTFDEPRKPLDWSTSHPRMGDLVRVTIRDNATGRIFRAGDCRIQKYQQFPDGKVDLEVFMRDLAYVLEMPKPDIPRIRLLMEMTP